jgi:8-oxo-dGTP diphosphatase
MSDAPNDGLVPRPSARVLLFDPQDRLFLVCYRSPTTGKRWWITVGGGLDEGETYEQAALRELREETGIEGVPLGPCVWTYEHVILDWIGRDVLMQERFYLVRAPSARIDVSGWDVVEREVLVDRRWWSLPQMEVAMRSFGPDETFAPAGIADLLRPILGGRIPSEPIAIRG